MYRINTESGITPIFVIILCLSDPRLIIFDVVEVIESIAHHPHLVKPLSPTQGLKKFLLNKTVESETCFNGQKYLV